MLTEDPPPTNAQVKLSEVQFIWKLLPDLINRVVYRWIQQLTVLYQEFLIL